MNDTLAKPTDLLDHITGRQVMDLLTACREKSSPIVVTHDPEILAGADRIVRLRDGKIVDKKTTRLQD